MLQTLRSSISAVVCALLVAIGFVALGPSQQVLAEQNGKMFDPGLIISDSVFFDFGTMTVADIQRFLDSKVPICNANDGGPTCLRYYKMSTQAKAGETGRCTALPAKTNQSAAQIIYDIAHACGINPRVLIVLLQKEQGLVQASNPTAYMYRAATGYGCPDSRPDICGQGSVITGLFNQLYRAAGQFQWYGDPSGSFTYLKVGKTISMRYHPDSWDGSKWVNKCGNASFLLKSQATANLYYYTPYTPNAAALKNLYGSGDSCSAYGNRNFWRFYSDWFGSPIGGGFLLKSADSDTYLIVDNKKYLVDDPGLVDSLKPLGPLGTISQEYLDSFVSSGNLTRLVKSSTGSLYVIDSGKKFSVANCQIAAAMSLDCATAVVLTANQLSALPSGGAASTLVVDADGNRYLIDDGYKRQILDDASVTAEGVSLPAKSGLSVSAFSDLPWGMPVAKPGSIFLNKSTGKTGVYVGGEFYELDKNLAKDVDFSKWFTKSTGTLNAQGLSQVYTNVTVKPIVVNAQGTYVITPAGKRLLTNPAEFGVSASSVNTAFTAAISIGGSDMTAPLLVQSGTDVLLVARKQLRSIATTTDLKALKNSLGAPFDEFSETALSQFSEGVSAFAPGSALKAKTSGKFYYVDDYNRLISFGSKDAFDLLILRKPRVVDDSLIAANKRAVYAGNTVECGGQTFVPWYGELMPIDSASLSAWSMKPLHLGDATCAKYDRAGDKIGQFAKDASTGKGWFISGGQKHEITSNAIYDQLRGTSLGYVTVESALIAGIPTGAVAKVNTPVVPPTGKTYKVVSGDTLAGIAAKFKTTVAKIKSLNKLTSDVIRVGQVLAIP